MSQQHLKPDPDEEEVVAEAVIVPPDGGWGWVIVVGSFLANAVVDGIIFTAGQGFLPIWEKEFTSGSAGTAAWVVSLLSGFYLLVGKNNKLARFAFIKDKNNVHFMISC